MLLTVTVPEEVSLAVCSPLDHENRRLSTEEKNSYRKAVIVLTILFLLIGVLFYVLGLNTYTVCI